MVSEISFDTSKQTTVFKFLFDGRTIQQKFRVYLDPENRVEEEFTSRVAINHLYFMKNKEHDINYVVGASSHILR